MLHSQKSILRFGKTEYPDDYQVTLAFSSSSFLILFLLFNYFKAFGSTQLFNLVLVKSADLKNW
jgi:hypothetical protein